MARKVIQVALNGVTGRMGYRQHLVRSLLAIRERGGIPLDGAGAQGGTVLYPEPVLVGRSEERLRAIAERHGLTRWTTSLDEVLGDPEIDVYFDTQVTSAREDAVARAIAAGKHVYTEKPVAATAAAAFALAEAARDAGITHGVVQDKLFLPGMIKLRRLIREGFLGRVLSVRVEFGYWVFEGDGIPAQRPSWNYRAADGGGIVLDMFPHWQYLLEDLFGPVSAVYARHATHLPRRWDEAGEPYQVTADDAAYAVLEFASGALGSVNSSWAVRVNRRELLELQVDGTHGSAVAGLRNCAVQHKVSTPMPVWNPDLPDPLDYPAMWTDVPDNMEFDNGFKAQWELFLRDAALGRPFRWDLFAGARGVQLAELALLSSAEGRRVEVPAPDTTAPRDTAPASTREDSAPGSTVQGSTVQGSTVQGEHAAGSLR
jgi:predicted dehydrogenase